MIKQSRIDVIIFLVFANLMMITGITVQAASIQDLFQIEAVKMLENPTDSKAEKIEESVEDPALHAMSQIQKQIEEQKIAEAERLMRYDQELLASIIFCEAGNQPYEGQVAVGAVVMNRVQSDKFPNTIEEVIYESGQFVPAMTGWLDNIRASSAYTESAMNAAKDALSGANPIGKCLFFDQGGHGYQIGAHYFH